jgi:glutamyl-tRNA synthetase/glutamyl-Q tRNA(Asp) synthetase
VYACDCSRKRIPSDQYDGFCRSRGLAEGPGRGIRVETNGAGDLLLRDRDGHWTYHFAVTVDDIDQQITHVIRGEDLQATTSRQVELRRMLGTETVPTYAHHPLILNATGEKLSKSAGDTGVRDLREAGLGADQVIGRAAAAVGLIQRPRSISARAVSELF